MTTLPKLKILDGKQISGELVRKRKAWAARWAAAHGKDAASEDGDGAIRKPKKRRHRSESGGEEEKVDELAQEEKGSRGDAYTEPNGPMRKKVRREAKREASNPQSTGEEETAAAGKQSKAKKQNKDLASAGSNKAKRRGLHEEPPTAERAREGKRQTKTVETKRKPNKFEARHKQLAMHHKGGGQEQEDSEEKRPMEEGSKSENEEKGEIEQKLEGDVQEVTNGSGLLEIIKAPEAGAQQRRTRKRSEEKTPTTKKVQSIQDLMGLTEPEVGLGIGYSWD